MRAKRTQGVFILACACLTLFLGVAVYASSPYPFLWEGMQYSVRSALTQQEGQTITCEATVARIVARNNPPYFVIRDEFRSGSEPEARIVVLCRPPMNLTSTVRVTGTLGRLPNNEPCILNPTVEGLFDQQGQPVYWAPFLGFAAGNWQVLPIPTGVIPSPDESLPAGGVFGDVSAYGTQGVSRYETIASLLASAPQALSIVELRAKAIISANAEQGYIIIGDDNNPDATLKIYTHVEAKPKARLVKAVGVVHTEAGQLVLYSGNGVAPYYDSQGPDAANGVSVASPGSVAYAASLRDTTPEEAQSAAMRSSGIGIMSLDSPTSTDGSWVYLTGQVVTGVGKYYSYDRLGHGFVPIYYIQGLDRTPGIRVVDMGSYTPSVSVGSIVDIMAEIDTKDGERILGIIDPWNTASVERKVLDSNWGLLPRPIGMGNNKALGGASVGNNPGIVGDPYGPYNIGSYVRVWGKVIESGTYQFEYDPYNATIPYMRIDDGSAVPSGNSVYGGPYGGQGITVFGTNTYNGYPTVDIGDYVAVTGVSSIWKPDGSDDTYRAIWAARDVQDLTASGSGYPPPNDTGTISGTVTLYDMTTSEVEVTLYSNFGKTETLTVSDGDNDHIGTASYSWTGIPLYDSQWGTARYMISAKADGYKTRTYTGITPWTDTATPKNFYLVPLRKIYLSTQDNRTYIGPCSPVSLNIGAMVLDDSHNPIEYDPNQPLNGGTVRFYTSAGSFHPTTLQHYTDATTTDDTYKCDWETLPNTIAIHAPSVYVNLTANPTGISRCGSSYSTVTAHVSVCSGAPPVGSVVNFTIGENDPCVFVSTGTKSATATTDANGDATVQVRADDAHHFGTAYVTASTNIYAGSGSSSVSVTVAEYAAKVQVSANPTDVTSSGVSDIVFTARNASDQPLQGLQLNIRTTAGTLSNMNPSNGITDANGQVSVRLTLNSPPSAYVSAFYSDDCMGSVQTGIPIAYRQSAWKDVAVGFSSPLVADIITGDNGRPEIGIIGRDGYTHIWKANGSDWDEQTFDDMISLDFYGDNTLSAADVDGRGGLEVIAPASSSTEVYAFGYNGNSFAQMAGWPVNTNTGYQFLAVSAALADVNLDGANETVAGDHCCWVFSWNGTGEWDSTYGNSYLWKNLTGSSGASITGSSVAIGDLDSDVQSMPDAVVGANSELYSFPGDEWGDRTSPPLYTPGWETPRSAGGSVQSSPAIGDIDGDGKNDVAVGSSAGLSIYRSGNDSWTTYQYGSVVRSSPALADLDGDGNKDVVFGCNNGKVYAVKCDGTAIAGWEDGILLHEDYYSAYAVESSPAIADVVSGTSDATGKPEVIVGCNDGFLYAIYANGVLHTDSSGVLTGPVAAVWCCRAYEWDSSRVYSSPTVDDIDGNGHADIIVGSEAGMWRFEVPVTFNRTDTIRYPWPTYHYDAARTGCITTPASPIYSSIVGQVRDTSGNLAIGAEVYIYFQSDATTSTVPVPKSSPVTYRTGAVKSVGNTGRTDINRGGYSINQLQPSGQTYKIKVVYGGVTKWKQNITLTSGLNIIDLNMSQL